MGLRKGMTWILLAEIMDGTIKLLLRKGSASTKIMAGVRASFGTENNNKVECTG